MTSYISLLPGLLAAFYILFQIKKGVRYPVAKAFLNIYLPSLLLLPQHFYPEIPILPDPTFSQSALIVIFFAHLFLSNSKSYPIENKIRLLDSLIAAFVVVCVFSEYMNSGAYNTHADSLDQNLWRTILFRNLLNVVLPYYLASRLIYPLGLTATFAKRIIVLTIISLVISAYEWRFVVNLHNEIFKPLFPRMAEINLVPTYRFGFVRIAGPFGHPILFGTVVAIGLILNHWLTKNKFWKNNLSFLPIPSSIKGFIIGSALFAGLVLTFSRGPLYSAILAFSILGVGYSRRRYRTLALRILLLAAVGIFAIQAISYYSEIDMNLARHNLEHTAAYRVQLIANYMKYVEERLWLGWGSHTWPTASHMLSIDNQYLWILLMHGVFALALQIAIFSLIMWRLFRCGMTIPTDQRQDQSLAFTLLSLLFMLCITLITVYMGGQVEPMVFMIIGLTQGFIDTKQAENRQKKKDSILLSDGLELLKENS